MTNKEWLECKSVNAFLNDYCSALSAITKNRYSYWLRSWVDYCCEQFRCNPIDLDFSKCTLNHVGEQILGYGPIQRSQVIAFLDRFQSSHSKVLAESCLRSMFRFLVRRKLLKVNPLEPSVYRTTYVPKQGPQISEIQFISQELKNLPLDSRAPLTLLLVSGLRNSELCALRLCDVSVMEGNCTIATCRDEALKGGVAYVNPLPEVSLLLKEYLEYRVSQKVEHDFFFIRQNGYPLSPFVLREYVRTFGESIGYHRRLTPHDFRRMFATFLASKIEPHIVARFMRHAHFATSFNYLAHPELNKLKKCFDFPSVKYANMLADEFLNRADLTDLSSPIL